MANPIRFLGGSGDGSINCRIASKTTFGLAIVLLLELIELMGEIRWLTLRNLCSYNVSTCGRPAPVNAREEALLLLHGHRISTVRIDEQRGDLTLEFEGNIVLEIITDSSGYESWSLRAPGKHVVAFSGGNIQDLSPEA